jgi:hypothetical protein
MTDTALIKNFNDIKRQLNTLSTYITAIGLKTGALVTKDDEPTITKSAPQQPTKDDMTPDELQELKEWEKKCDDEVKKQGII